MTPCPKCRTSELAVGRIAGARSRAMICPRCNGLWLHASMLDALDRQVELETPIEPDQVADSRTGLCPFGHGILARARTDDDAFFLERCMKCNGIWFDRGEWHALAGRDVGSTLLRIWSPEWQRLRRAREVRASLIESARQSIGEVLFDRIDDLASELANHPARNQAIAYLLDEIRRRAPREGGDVQPDDEAPAIHAREGDD